MHIQLETPDKHTIQSYTNEQVTVNGTLYQRSLIVSKQTIVTPWAVYCVDDLNEITLEPILELEPEIILIGHQDLGKPVPISILQYLSTRRLGIECMSIGAMSRTFNVLLSEHRQVVAGIILERCSSEQ